MSPIGVGVIGIVILIVLLLSRLPVGFTMLLVGFLGFSYLTSLDAGLGLIARDFFSTFASWNLSVIPLFILMGQIAFHAGMGQRLYHTAYKWLGHRPGGLAMATVAACAGFASICGSSPATAATIGAIALPEMRKYNYDASLATGCTAAGGTLGVLIPPSITFVIYGILTEQSIGKLFYAGILPGIILATIFIVTIYIWAQINPRLAPPGPVENFREKVKSLTGVWETLALFLLVMGGLYSGFFTPTEAGGVGSLGALVIGLIRRGLTRHKFVESLVDTTRTTAMLLLILAGAIIFSRFLAVTRIPFEMADWVVSLPLHRVSILAIILVFYIIGGCLMEILGLVILTIPIFYPVVIALGFDPIWFGVIIVIMCEMGVITPPVGVNVYVIGGVAKDVPLSIIFKGILPFFVGMVICVIILIIFPKIALFLPGFVK